MEARQAFEDRLDFRRREVPARGFAFAEAGGMSLPDLPVTLLLQ